jgi:hypothetical protein
MGNVCQLWSGQESIENLRLRFAAVPSKICNGGATLRLRGSVFVFPFICRIPNVQHNFLTNLVACSFGWWLMAGAGLF